MAIRSTAQQRYLETSISTSSPEELIIKLFDGLILFSTQALEKMEASAHDVEGIHKCLLRAQKACCLLMGSLDMEIGGDLATNLFRVYEFWHHELVMANMQKEPSRITRILPDFKDYRATWMEAISRFKAEQRMNAQAVVAAQEHPPATGTSSFAAIG
ncbi:MAG: flagellar export chaperone FliS [Candidatus Eremiobacteraeota bacterium]|nr:flagellar export chaperone FliS [Candidatus Eremiobacteraeota bacterium]